MIRQSLDRGWELTQGRGFPPRETATVDLPHDWAIGTAPDPASPGGGGNGYYGGAFLTYTKALDIPEAWQGERVLLEVDGAYRNAEVLINGGRAAFHAYGYTPFHADLTPHLRFGGENELRIAVNNSALPNSRWYSGTGLYRHVDLLRLPAVGVAPWGVFVRAERLEEDYAVVVAEITADNATGEDARRTVRVSLREGDTTVAEALTQLWTPAGGSNTAFARFTVDDPKLWSPDEPFLYGVTVELLECEAVTDRVQTTAGLRTVAVDPKRGFLLNGQPLLLKGGCVHHDHGILGAAAFDAAEERKVRLHKRAGYNALRCAHNPPSRGFLEACDRIGILVMDEAFDQWRGMKNINDYHLDFDDCWRQDIDAMVLRDRNHPSVVIWSIGNEIPDQDDSADGWKSAQLLAARVRSHDKTRPVCAAMNNVQPPMKQMAAAFAAERPKDDPTVGFFNNDVMREYNRAHFFEDTEGYSAPLDVIGYNYIDYLYEETLARYPNRVLCGTESFPLSADLLWAYAKKHPQIIGDFTWTSCDYLGEAGLGRALFIDPNDKHARGIGFGADYPWRASFDADIDLCGFPRPQLAYRRIVWGSGETCVAVRDPKYGDWEEQIAQWGWPQVHRHWSWPGREGMNTRAEVYSAADEVELLLNGRSLGKQPAGEAYRFKARFTLPYEPGELIAVSYAAGREISRDTLRTVGPPARIALLPEKTVLRADGQDLCFAVVEVRDAAGDRVPTAEIPLTASVGGPGSLQALGSAKPDTTELYTSGSFTTFEGRALAVVRPGHDPGEITLTVSADTLPPATVKIQSQIG